MGITQDNTIAIIAEVDRRCNLGLQEIADALVKEAKRIVPVKTGALQRSITSEIDKSTNTLVVGSALHYAPYVEVRKPYLRPALEKVRMKIAEVFDEGAI